MKAKNVTLATALFLTVVLLASACGPSRVPVQVAPAQPAARADLRVGSDPNDNTTIDLRVRHLAEPQRLSPPRNVYVVWIQPQERDLPERLGQLQVDRSLEGRLRTVTPYRQFELLVTAEDEPGVAEPSDQIALRTTVNR